MIAYLAPKGFEEELARELPPSAQRYGRLFLLKEAPLQTPAWVQNSWLDPRILSISSLGDAAKQLRALGSLWVFYPYLFPGKGKLVAEKLPYFSPKPLLFPCALPKGPLGSWMFLDEKTILASPNSSSPFAHGEPNFLPSKIPPSRAYLKLWELFTLTQEMPKPGALCLDAGASPGGWSWVLQKLGASVLAVDRAPLCPSIASLDGIESLKKDAFSLKPDLSIDWLFSDAACTPEKLLAWIRLWLEAGSKANMICTLKFQGFSDLLVIREFEKIENSRIVHLSHNKHELTWLRFLAKQSSTLAK